MKSILRFACCTSAAMILLNTGCSDHRDQAPAVSSSASSGEQAFLDAYRKALETADTKTLDSFLLADGTPAEVVEFFKMMRDIPAGAKLVDVKLESPTAGELAKFNEALPMPDGKSCKLPIVPTKKLVVTMKEDTAESESTSTATLPVAEKDGKFIIPLPVPAA